MKSLGGKRKLLLLKRPGHSQRLKIMSYNASQIRKLHENGLISASEAADLLRELRTNPQEFVKSGKLSALSKRKKKAGHYWSRRSEAGAADTGAEATAY